MQIHEVIRTYRKNKNMTQDDMAKCLGVTASAVNKWENGNSFPDITLLAPIARLLDISLDTLLSFQDELTVEDTNRYVEELDKRLKTDSFADTFTWAKRQLELYPNCEQLMLWFASILDAQLMLQKIDDSSYQEYIRHCYTRVLHSTNESIRTSAAGSLFHSYRRNKEFDKAEECLSFFSDQNPEKKSLQAILYADTGVTEDAYRTSEELLFASYGRLSAALNSIYMLAMKENDHARAHMLVEKQAQLAELFEMGAYTKAISILELAVAEQDMDLTLDTMETLLANVDTLTDFRHSPLYEHMTFKEPREDFIAEIRQNLLNNFRDTETFGFVADTPRYQKLFNQYS